MRWLLVALSLAACGVALLIFDRHAEAPERPASPGGGPIPTPIGRGPRFLPSAHGPAFGNQPSPACSRKSLKSRYRVHLELFAAGRVVIVPAGIGVAAPRRSRLGRIGAAQCRSPLWTLDPTGVVYFDRRGLTLGDFFEVWGRQLGRGRLLSFASRRGSPVLAFVNGARRRGDPRAIPLRDGAEIVVEISGFVPPHRSYLFPPREG